VEYIPLFLGESDPQELLFGRGFYVARGAGQVRRVGFGVHNTALFMLEQAGPIGLLLGFNLFWVFLAEPWRQMRKNSADSFARLSGGVIFAWSFALIIVSQAGQIFWIVETLTGWFTVVLCIWCLLIRPMESPQRHTIGTSLSPDGKTGFAPTNTLVAGRGH
jgi:O-antigen ligase